MGNVKGFLSKRMLSVAAFVTRGNRTADIGCDHAYTSIYLVQEGIAPRVIAMDVGKGPLSRARANIRLFGAEGKIELRLSDGLAGLSPGEADTVLLAGMGGLLMQRILSQYPKTLETVRELVLQPQSELAQTRRFLHELGFCITAEAMLIEDGKYYTVLQAKRGKKEVWDDVEYCYGKRLMEACPPELERFLAQEYEKTELVLKKLRTANTEKAKKRQEELQGQLERNHIAQTRLAARRELPEKEAVRLELPAMEAQKKD